jgi:chlorite dismutase
MLNIFRKKRKKITDDILGTLTFRESSKLDESYWNVDRKMNSADELVEFYIYNNSDGINENQKELILTIEKRYPELIDSIELFINEKINEIDSKSEYVSIRKSLDVHFINIPKNLTKLNKWELNLVEKKGFANYEIEIENWIPIDLGISA